MAEGDGNLQSGPQKLFDSESALSILFLAMRTAFRTDAVDKVIEELGTENENYQILVEQTKQKRMLLTQLSELSRQVNDRKDQLERIKMQIRQRRIANMELFAQVEDLKEQRQNLKQNTINAEDKRLRDEYTTLHKQNCILRKVFMKSIMESGINWAQEPALLSLTLQLDALPMSDDLILHSNFETDYLRFVRRTPDAEGQPLNQ
ncbi:MAG: hypothetical protein EZS28_001860 [Streblomastix strix]|uniref:Centromere protein H C-terminal domain-containing protein n=1 Tax=Streblomastix strix TaxID=222440 RepID=A0A5J4X5W4_9EUKA|nr:MAG: hypothetical protein EZS28_001860 [Streblomastix strix]